MIIEAEITDSTHLRLLQPIEAKAGTRISLEIVDSEREEFLAAASVELERAYSNDEPDYSEAGTPISQ